MIGARAALAVMLAVMLAAMVSAGTGMAQSVGVPPKGMPVPASAAKPAQDAFQGERPHFEVATIKPSDPANCCARTWNAPGRRFETHNTSLRWLLRWAYGVQDKQIAGGPAWLDEDRYEVAGEIDGEGAPSDAQWRIAVQQLLTDRFALVFHHESREMPAYVLTVAKGGAKLTPNNPEKYPASMVRFSGASGKTMQGVGRDVTLRQFMGEAQRLSLDRPVVDRTGITGTYDLELTFTREDPASTGLTDLPDDAAPNLFKALEQQLGLKLERANAPVDVLVIDNVTKPSAD